MRSRFSVGVILIIVVLLAVSSLGSSRPSRVRFAQVGPSPTPTSLATDTPTATTGPGPTDTPTSTGAPPGPTNTPGPGGPTSRPGQGRGQGEPATPGLGIAVNRCARIEHSEGLNLSTEPGFNKQHVQIVGNDDVVFVTEGPVRSDGKWWWQVITRDGVRGWGDNDRLRVFSGACFGLSATGTPVVSPTQAAGSAANLAAVSGTPMVAQDQLPVTGAGGAALIIAVVLAGIVFIVGLLRRRMQGSV